MTALVAGLCGVLGLLIGSFLNVVIWRVPRGESVVHPPSHCPQCEAPVAPADNIPVVSWLVLRGRCRQCRVRIPIRYPAVELLTGVSFAAVAVRFAGNWALPAYLLLTAGLVALSVIDVEHYLLPNRIVYPLGFASVPLLALASWGEHDWTAFVRALMAACIAFAVFFVIHLVSPRGMGFGDVRLSFVLGLYLGWLGWGYLAGGLFAAFVYGAVIGIGVLVVGGAAARKRPIPFGPFLALGAMTFVLAGAPIIDWYVSVGT